MTKKNTSNATVNDKGLWAAAEKAAAKKASAANSAKGSKKGSK